MSNERQSRLEVSYPHRVTLMSYYVGDGNQQRGPFTLEQLRARGCGPTRLCGMRG